MANHGYAPYEEAAVKGQMRMSTLQRIGQIFAGAGQGLAATPQNAGGLESLFTGFAGGYKGASAAQQAAEQYAMKKIDAENAQRHQDFQDRLMQSEIDKNSRPVPPEKPVPVMDWQRSPDEQAAIIAFETKKAKALAAGKPPAQTYGQMSDEALNQAADLYATTGQMAGFGFGATPDRAAVRNRAALRHPSTDIAANRAEYQKNQKTITNVQNLRDLSGAWENTVLANGRVMMEAYKGIPEAQNMPLNYVLRHGAGLAGSSSVAAFNTARETFKNEVARLLNQPGGSGGQVLSDASRKEVERITSGNLTGRQLQASFDIIKRDAANKRTGYDRQIEQIRSRIRTRFGVSPDINLNQQPDEQGVLIWNPDTGNLEPAQ